MHLYTVFLVVVSIPFAIALTQKSAFVTQVQSVPNGSSPEKMIMCAFALMKSDNAGFRTAKGMDDCEQLTFDQLTMLTNSSFEPEFEYFEKTTVFNYHDPPRYNYAEKVVHYLYSEVQVGDKFQFMFQKSDIDRFTVIFKDSGATNILMFTDYSSSLQLNDGHDKDNGEAETPLYPFSDFKEYKIVFEVLQSHWQIYIDDVAFTTFVHRRPVQLIKMIRVQTGPAVAYLTKILDPRLTGQEDQA